MSEEVLTEEHEHGEYELDLRAVALTISIAASLATVAYLAWCVYRDWKFDRTMSNRWDRITSNLHTMRHDVIVAVAPSVSEDESENL